MPIYAILIVFTAGSNGTAAYSKPTANILKLAYIPAQSTTFLNYESSFSSITPSTPKAPTYIP